MTGARRLCQAVVADLPSPVVRPSYPRAGLLPGVVHLGLGAFHRAHQAMVFDRLLASGDRRWGVMGVAMRSTDVADALTAQDGLYSVQVASAEGTYWQVVGSILQCRVAAREPDQVLAALGAPHTRWVTLTVTEKGYTADLAALIVSGLGLRHDAGLPGLTLASCDNLSGNGDLLRTLCLQAADNASLRSWINSRCAFPNSMVDRIVPAATAQRRDEAAAALRLADKAALATEGFWEWVIEDAFADPEDAAVLRSAGVTVAAAVKPFEEAKLGMLNGSHSAIACIGAVLGLPTVFDCVSQPDIRQFVHQLMTHEVMPHLHRPGLPAYRDALLARFANPALQHRVHQIASDSSQKIPQRWVPAITAQIKAGRVPPRLALAAAVWMRYCLAEDEQGKGYAIADPMADAMKAAANANRSDPSAAAQALLALGTIWGASLPGDAQWLAAVTNWLGRVHTRGVLACLKEVNEEVNEEVNANQA